MPKEIFTAIEQNPIYIFNSRILYSKLLQL